MEAVGGLGDDGELMGDQVDACTGEAAGFRLAEAAVPFEGLESELEVARVIAHPGEQTIARRGEAEGV